MIWNIFTVAPQRERRVAAEIRQGLGLQVCVPCVQKHRRSRGKGGRPQLIPYLVPVMPGYVFAGSRDPLPIYDIRAIEHVRGMVKFGSVIATLSDAEVDQVRRMAQNVEIPSGFKVGDKLRIIHGPFTDFERLISEIRGGDVRVDVELFGKPAPVWLRPDQFEKVEAA